MSTIHPLYPLIRLPLSLLLLAIALCGLSQNAWAVTPLSGESVELEVAPWKTPCSYAEAYHGMCLVVRKVGQTQWTQMPDAIKDFKHAWGHAYTIRILVHTPTVEMTDSLGTEEFLTKLISDTPTAPSTTFDVVLDTTLEPLGWAALYRIDPDFSGGQFIDGQRFVCVNPDHCKTLHAATSRTMPQYTADRTTPLAFKATFTFPASPSVPLQLTALAPHS